jgi:thioredoxin reductase
VLPVRLETFAAYGLAFQKRMVPELEQKLVVRLDRTPGGFILQLENGETVAVCRVILAVGITHFSYVPGALSHLPSDVLSHSYSHHDLEKFAGRSVVVVGGGASATDLAGLLHEAKAKVQLVARQSCLKFHNRATGKPRSLWQRMRYPNSGLGPGLRSRFFANGPLWFYCLPQHFRLEMVRTQLGPVGGWFAKDMVIGRVPLLLGYTLQRAQVNNGGVLLQLRATDGTERKVLAEHIIAATGYKVDLERLNFLSAEIRSGIKAVNGAPILSRVFESSVPGLYFVGIAAANSFGPVMRFAFGASFAARHMTRNLTKLLAVGRSFAAVPASIENREKRS